MARRNFRLACLVAAVVMATAGFISAAVGSDKLTAQSNRLVLKRDYGKLADILERAASAGNSEAQYRLAGLYRVGLGVVRDENRIRYLLRRASNAGYRKATQLLKRLEANRWPKTAAMERTAKTDFQASPPFVKADTRDGAGNSWLDRAATRGQLRVLAAMSSSARSSPSSLLAAAKAGQTESVLLLLRSGASVNATDTQGRTALMFSAAGSSPVLTANLLASGADTAQRDIHGRSALDYAVRGCNIHAVRALVLGTTSLRDLSRSPPLLHLATQHCPRRDVMESLLPHVDIDDPDTNGATALLSAVSRDELEIAGLLLVRQANPNLKDGEGMAPLHIAALRCQPGIVNVLLQKGADMNAASSDGNTPLMLAAASDCTEAMALLISARADIDATNLQGDAALLIAVRAGHVAATKLLLAVGAQPAARNARRETAASVAEQLGRTDIARLLPSP